MSAPSKVLTRGLLLWLCAAVGPALAEQAPMATPPAATAPAAAPATAAPAATAAADTAPAAAPADASMATVIFYRPSRFVGGAIGFIVREGTKELGKLRSGRYFTLQVSPGKHEFVVHSEAKDTLTIDAEAGETYYIRGEIGVGIVAGRPHLYPADKAAFEAEKGKLKLVAPLSDKD